MNMPREFRYNGIVNCNFRYGTAVFEQLSACGALEILNIAVRSVSRVNCGNFG